jgi:hypothetical protein
MKTYASIILSVLLNVTAFAADADQTISLLSSNVATCKDEMFHFRVTYSDVHCDTNGLRFTQTLLHKESQASGPGSGSYKVVIVCALPLDILKSAKREVLIDEGIGHNTQVRIELPEKTPPTFAKITTEIINDEGKKTVETNDAADGPPFCNIYFSDSKTAKDWNEALSKHLK